jgi:hypothetical protein
MNSQTREFLVEGKPAINRRSPMIYPGLKARLAEEFRKREEAKNYE